MDTLRAYLIKSYWTQTFFRLATAKTFFSAIGLFWLLTEISSFVFESWRAPLQSSWMYFLYMSCAYTLWQRRPIISICERLNGTDVRVEIRIADIFSLPHAKVISTNTTFETTVDETLISSRSLQGKFTKRFYKSSKQLDIELASALKMRQHFLRGRGARTESVLIILLAQSHWFRQRATLLIWLPSPT